MKAAPRARHGVAGRAGFLLLEALIALALVGAALLVTLALFAAEARFRRVASARAATLSAAEDLLELVRSRAVPFETTTLENPELEALLDRPLPRATAWVEVAPSGVPGLADVTVTVRYLAAGRLHVVRLPTRVRAP